jgi:uncharacterized protein YsxB (DUF464 family)
MIKININYKNNLIDSILIKGHAEYNENSKDIVCSAVSSIAITTVNGIMKIDHTLINFEEKDGYLKIEILKHNEICDTLINNMIDLLEELTKQYSKYIKIMK